MDTSSTVGGTQEEFCASCMQFPKNLYHCALCTCFFCGSCWLQQLTHRPGVSVRVPHEKVPLNLYHRLRDAFNPPPNAESQSQLHSDDMDTKWFAVLRRDDANSRTFYDTGRYASLIASASRGKAMDRYPSLVSFVGQTGAGKSTLVKILIERQLQFLGPSRDTASSRELFRTPVVGTTGNSTEPTSGDVHLYPEPISYYDESPIFFVDSEGLEGGERLPVASRHTTEPLKEDPPSAQVVPPPTPGVRPRKGSRSRAKISKKWRFSREVSRDIHWTNTPERERREFAVTHFYPRILYSFSDVIVFVLRNPRTFESAVVSRLVDWAAEVLNCATNQPRLPHAIIALNACDRRTDPRQWDVNVATETLLGSVSTTLPSSAETERLSRLMKHWNRAEKPVRSLRDLLECYYSSIRVVCIPTDEQYHLVDQQIGKLYKEIQATCVHSHRAKRDARMRLNADELDELFQKAFDHFSNSLDAPFDMVEAARKNMPIPRDFAGNVTKVAVFVRDVQDLLGQANLTKILEHLARLVASCIFLDCRRSRWKGSVVEFFDRRYREACETALNDFFAQFWPCDYQFADGRGRCVNTYERHQKGHQLGTSKYRSRHEPGGFQSSTRLSALRVKWIAGIRYWIDYNESGIKRGPVSTILEDAMVHERHGANIRSFYKEVGGSLKYVSHSICLCCLRELPEHPLQCGHVLCTACFQAYAHLEAQKEEDAGASNIIKGDLKLSRCPLHPDHKIAFQFQDPRIVRLKPDGAGVRILCLDGGGIRGIVELEVLWQLEQYLGGNIPIQTFFDLIVGTSTGGLIAAGLGVMNWRVDDCVNHFLTLADKAFTKRSIGIQNIPLLGRIGRKYKTRPFEETLKETFGEKYLFGGRLSEDASQYNTKVALTSTTGTGTTPLVLSNYNRPGGSEFNDFVRPDHPDAELKIWEALRATTAAPGYFSCFKKAETGQRFVDGALYHNNPVYVAWAESKLIWPDVRHREADIILSIGTGHNGRQTGRPMRYGPSRLGSVSTRPLESYRDRSIREMRPTREDGSGHVGDVSQNLKVIFTMMANVLSTHYTWIAFRNERVLQVPDDKLDDVEQRFQRLDPNLGFEPPSLDKKELMPELRTAVRRNLQLDGAYREKIRHIARQLVASSFYFERDRQHSVGSGRYEFHGRILCRFPNNSYELSNLGDFLTADQAQPIGGTHLGRRSYPFFRISERSRPTIDIELTTKDLARMAKGSLSFFNLDRVAYTVSSKNAEVTISMVFNDAESKTLDAIPISGFPRALVAETSQNTHHQDIPPKSPLIDLRKFWDDPKSDDSFNSIPRWPLDDGHDLNVPAAVPRPSLDCPTQRTPDWEERRLRHRRGIADLTQWQQNNFPSPEQDLYPAIPPISEHPPRVSLPVDALEGLSIYQGTMETPLEHVPENVLVELDGGPIGLAITSDMPMKQYRYNYNDDQRDLDSAVEKVVNQAPNHVQSRLRGGLNSQRAFAEAIVAGGFEPPEITEEFGVI